MAQSGAKRAPVRYVRPERRVYTLEVPLVVAVSEAELLALCPGFVRGFSLVVFKLKYSRKTNMPGGARR